MHSADRLGRDDRGPEPSITSPCPCPSPLWTAPPSPGRLRRTLPPRTLSPSTLFFWGGVACPQAALDLAASILGSPVANPTQKNQGGAQVGYFRLGGPLISLELYRPHPGLRRKWKRHRLESRSRRGQAALSVGKGRASQDPGWRPAPPTGLRWTGPGRGKRVG